MTTLNTLPEWFFDKVIFRRPQLVICCVLVVVALLGYKAQDFRLDASAETLIIENDRDLNYSRLIDNRYGVQDFLLLAYTPQDDLFSDNVLADLERLKNELLQMERVSSVVSILNVPLLKSRLRN